MEVIKLYLGSLISQDILVALLKAEWGLTRFNVPGD